MHGKNIIFAIFAPLVLMAIIAVIVVSIGETLLALHELGIEVYHVGSYATEEENHDWAEKRLSIPSPVRSGSRSSS